MLFSKLSFQFLIVVFICFVTCMFCVVCSYVLPFATISDVNNEHPEAEKPNLFFE